MTRACRLALSAAAVALLASCAIGPASPPVALAGERNGLTIKAELAARDGSLHVSLVARNERNEPAYLVPDQCGRITEVSLARTQFEPAGATWTGSAQAVKELILRDQVSRQAPDRFHPRRPTGGGSETPPCVRPDRPIELVPGGEIAERWELASRYAYSLEAVGSAASVVRLEVVEERDRDELEFLDVLPTGAADEARAGRNLRIDQPASSVIDRPAPADDGKPSLGEIYDRLLEHGPLLDWIQARPVNSWRLATMTPPSPFVPAVPTEQVRLRLISSEYERAARVTARADGSEPAVDLPTAADRARQFERRPGTLPPGIAVVDEPDAFVLGEDVLPGSLNLPSGRLVVGEYLDEEPLELAAPPGAYPVHATLATYPGEDRPEVALATLVLSDEPTVRWAEMGSFAVDGGSARFISIEGAAVLNAALEDVDGGTELSDRILDSRAAHDYLLTELPLADGVNLVEFSSGYGDGSYPVFVGFDAGDRPTRVVVDFYLLHLAWPE